MSAAAICLLLLPDSIQRERERREMMGVSKSSSSGFCLLLISTKQCANSVCVLPAMSHSVKRQRSGSLHIYTFAQTPWTLACSGRYVHTADVLTGEQAGIGCNELVWATGLKQNSREANQASDCFHVYIRPPFMSSSVSFSSPTCITTSRWPRCLRYLSRLHR